MELQKICSECQLSRTFDNFHTNKKGVYGLHNKCKDCRNRNNRQKNNQPIAAGSKLCKKCNNLLNVSEFNKDKTKKLGLQTYCKSCSTNNIKRWTSSLDGYINKIYLDIVNNSKKSKKPLDIKITIDDIKQLYFKQNGLCALSGIKITFDTYMTNDFQNINRYNMVVNRIDDKLGYEKNNIQLICSMVHKMKNVYNNDEFINMCKIIGNYNI